MALVVSLPERMVHASTKSRSFYINLPFGAVAAAAFCFAFVPPIAAQPVSATTREKVLQMDIPGVVLISGTIICFTLAMRWAGVEHTWKSSEVVGTLVGTVVLAVAFAADQWYQGERALLLTSFLKNRTLLVGSIFELL